MEKVTAFVTRGDGPERELLTFTHGGRMQVPAGTVEMDEDPRDAVVREVHEETGIRRVRILRRVAILSQQLAAGSGIALRTSELRDGPSSGSPLTGFSLRRGLYAEVQDTRDDQIEVTGHGIPADAPDPDRAPLTDVRGWMPAGDLSRSLVRHCFHLVPKGPTPDAWSQDADHGYVFDCRWVPLDPRPELTPRQRFWLDRSYELLR